MCVCAEEVDKFFQSNGNISKTVAEWQMAYFLNLMIRYMEMMTHEDQASFELKEYFLRVKPFVTKYNFKNISLRLYYLNPGVYSFFRDYIRNPLLRIK
jgi:hypothetical protein